MKQLQLLKITVARASSLCHLILIPARLENCLWFIINVCMCQTMKQVIFIYFLAL